MKVFPLLLASLGFASSVNTQLVNVSSQSPASNLSSVNLANGTHTLRNGFASGRDGPMPAPVPQLAVWDPNDIATAEVYEQYRAKGSFLGCLIDASDLNAGKAWYGVLRSVASDWKGTLESM
jgi:hypothetical protein